VEPKEFIFSVLAKWIEIQLKRFHNHAIREIPFCVQQWLFADGNDPFANKH